MAAAVTLRPSASVPPPITHPPNLRSEAALARMLFSGVIPVPLLSYAPLRSEQFEHEWDCYNKNLGGGTPFTVACLRGNVVRLESLPARRSAEGLKRERPWGEARKA